MKKIYTFAFIATTMMSAQQVVAQTEYTILSDVTSKLQNADFSADAPITTTIRTYDSDMPDKLGVGNGGTGLFGQQTVTGWTATFPSDNTYVENREDGANARAAGVFAYVDDTSTETTFPGLGGDYWAPYIDNELGITGQALGMVAVWGASVSYTQDVTLEAGAYMIIASLHNTAGGSAALESNNGFVAENGTKYMSDKLHFQTLNWEKDTIVFELKETTNGKISIGYKSGNYGSSGAMHLFYDNIKLYTIDPTPLHVAQIAAAKEELLKVIEDGQYLGVSVSAARAVYNDPSATLEQVKKAIEDQKAINAAGQVDFSSFFITNPHFTLGTPITDGITTYDYDMVDPNGNNGKVVEHYGMQPVEGWEATSPGENARASGIFTIGSDAFLGGGAFLPPTSMSDGSTEGNLLGFLSVWTAVSQYKQNVTIPAGTYTLKISYYNGGGTTAIAKNLMGFVTDEGIEHLSDLTTFVQHKWDVMTIKFKLDEPTSGYFTVGYQAANVGSGGMPHLFIDGISLYYVGDIDFDPSLIALDAAVNSATKTLEEYFQQSLKEELEQATYEGAELVSSQSDDAEANKEAADNINNLIGAAKTSIAAYTKMAEFYDGELQDLITEYETKLPTYGEYLINLSDEIMMQLSDEATWSAAEIDSILGNIGNVYKEEVQKAWDAAVASGEKLEEDLDITCLFEQLAYTYSTTAQSNTNVPDKEWQYGNATNFKTQYGTAEVWNQTPFKVFRTMKNMPAGKYTITTKAYYRTSENVSNYANYDPSNELAFVFAGHSKTALTNVAEIASSDQTEFTNTAEVGEALYVPNNQEAAWKIFTNDVYNEKLQKSVSTVLAAEGDLTFGISGEQMEDNCWVVWYSFSISYNALEEELLDKELEGLIAEANEMQENGVGNVIAAMDMLNNSTEAGENALSGSMDDKCAAMEALSDAIEYGSKSVTLTTQLEEVFNEYLNLLTETEIVSSDETLTNLLDDVTNGMNDGFKDNEQVQSYIDQFPAAWSAYILGQDLMASATEDESVDVTGVIKNASFDLGNANFWTIKTDAEDQTIGQNYGYQGAEYVNAETGCTISQFIEAWRPNGAALSNGNIEQTINAVLPEGYYTLEVDAQAINQAAVPEEGVLGVYLMAYNIEDTWTTSVCINTTASAPEHFTLNFYSDGVNLTTVGLRVEDTNANWLAADNFTLKYIGKTAPVGIDNIEVENNKVDLVNAKNIYSITGQRLNKVQKGLNIVDGKKIFIK